MMRKICSSVARYSMASKFQSSPGDDTVNRRNKAVAIKLSFADSGCPIYIVCNEKETRKVQVASGQKLLINPISTNS